MNRKSNFVGVSKQIESAMSASERMEVSLADMSRPFVVGDLAVHRLSGIAGRVTAVEAIGDVDQLLTIVTPATGARVRAQRKEFNLVSSLATPTIAAAPVSTEIEVIAVDQVVTGYGENSLADELC